MSVLIIGARLRVLVNNYATGYREDDSGEHSVEFDPPAGSVWTVTEVERGGPDFGCEGPYIYSALLENESGDQLPISGPERLIASDQCLEAVDTAKEEA